MFVQCGMSDDIPVNANFKEVCPFVATLMAAEAILIALPQISLFLPNTMIAF